ncbi:von Willebrand factor isoform X3 [Ornithorhynchus anatinus]|uniref:von Willebrand factor isoform X3 n=1 Tax=Ornithorhynchus anatinus TaxID=9258 RepID=UPI0010A8795A|nr:von Willebrand factor isoform X3 [Ornithorhynchus anatinus]
MASGCGPGSEPRPLGAVGTRSRCHGLWERLRILGPWRRPAGKMAGDGVPLVLLHLVLGAAGFRLVEGGISGPWAARCSLFGRDHLKTFDENVYSFSGDCSYMLAGDCRDHTFSLLGTFERGRRTGISVYLGEFFDIHLFANGSVIQGGTSVSMPYASRGLHLENEAGYYKVSSTVYGFEVRMDTGGDLQLFLAGRHLNATCGLCGNANRFAEDDLQTQEGTLTDNPYDFANSWALRSGEQHCHRISPPSATCNTSSEEYKALLDQCQLLKQSSVFTRCHLLVNPEPFQALCQQDACHCTLGEHCPCSAFLEYARSCAQEGEPLEGWVAHSKCRPECPPGMEYKECVSPCAETCQSLNIHEVCQGPCTDGCTCPEGKLLDGDRCVDSADCSCVHSGQHYPPGASIARDCNTCICRHSVWVCSNQECPGECLVTGQSHFKSFDNRYFTFSGVCQYLLARDCQDHAFSIVIETIQCADDPDAVCTRSATVRLADQPHSVLKLKHGGGVSLDGQDIQVPLVRGALRVQHTIMASVRLTYGEDLQVDWDGRGTLLVKISPIYFDKTCGLCGNYNGNQGDDFLAPSGLEEPSVEGFGNAWKLRDDCQNLQKQDSDPCHLNPRLARFAEQACSVLTSSTKFEACRHVLSVAPYRRNCHYDVCSCADGPGCLCTAIAAYAAACAQRGVVVDWREPGFCAVSCPAGRVFQSCGTPCNQTCRSLSHPDGDCEDLCLEGCFCPPGLFANERGDCVPRAQCPCSYDGELFQPEDVFSDHHTLCYCEDGSMRCSTNQAPGASLSDEILDSHPSPRVKRSLNCRPPLVRLVCPADDPRAEGLECMRTCQNYDLECVSSGCVSGCLCPQGMVRHGDRCLSPERCPCFHNGKEFAPGESVQKDCNICVCRARRWECTDHVCDATCSALGPAHYLTFDGLHYLFSGVCQYVLAQDYCGGPDPGTFRILVANDGCGFAASKCNRRVTVLFAGGEIELSNGEVVVKTPPSDEASLEVLESGRYYILLLGPGMSLTWDRNMGVSVILKQTHQGRVCGLCGNFDGVQNNDLISRSLQLEVDAADFGNSWKVTPQCADAPRTPDSSLATCRDNVMKQMTVDSSCRILTSDPFRRCNQLVNPEPYVDACIYDTCSCDSVGDCGCFCDAVAAYAHACAQHGEVVIWRTTSLCPQSCEDRNQHEDGYECEWRYNSCAPACPVTCQHPEPLACPVKCVEGCHAHCPPGKILDELLQACIHPSDCPVCELEGRRLAAGKRIVLNREDPGLCQMCHCDGGNLTCEACLAPGPATAPPPTSTPTEEQEEEEEEEEEGASPEPPLHDLYCSKMLDMAFLLDGSNRLSEPDFETLKSFVVDVMERLDLSQKRVRVAVVEYHDGAHSYIALRDRKRPSTLRRLVRGVRYAGAPVASASEALKYALFQIFGKAPRTNAARVALLLSASEEPRRSARNLARYAQALRQKKITVVAVGIGPHASARQVRLLERQAPDNRAFLLASVAELEARRDDIVAGLCEQAPDLPPATAAIVPGPRATSPAAPSTSSARPGLEAPDVVFVLEGSDRVGEANFNLSKDFLQRVVRRLDVAWDRAHVSVLQFADAVTVEHAFSEAQTERDVLRKVRDIPFRGGHATNAGRALRHVAETTLAPGHGRRERAPHLVYMVVGGPVSDRIERPPRDLQVVAIGVGPQAHARELSRLGWPNAPILIPDFDALPREAPDLVLQSCCSGGLPQETPTLSPAPADCVRPVDVIFLLDGTSRVPPDHFENMKSFVKAFIEKADIGPHATQVSVLQYGSANTLDVPWSTPQGKASLLSLVDPMQREGGPGRIGDALSFAVRYALSEAHGARPNASKVAVVLVTDESEDSVDAAAAGAQSSRVVVFPVGIGDRYDRAQLRALAGPSPSSRVTELQRVEDLPLLVSLDRSFTRSLCSDMAGFCLDDDGNTRKPGDTWTLPDQCHTVTCLPDGRTAVESHWVSCERAPKPTCSNGQPPARTEGTCGCHWTCPCLCMGSSTRHIVTFDGQDFKLTGSCSYVLFREPGRGTELVLHNGACGSKGDDSQSGRLNCMRSIRARSGDLTIELNDHMEVTVNGTVVSVPFVHGDVEVNIYGAIMFEMKFSPLGHVLTFTPQNNEFQLQLSPKAFATPMSGLCGLCDENRANDLTLPDGSVTRDRSALVQAWMESEPGQECEPLLDQTCPASHRARCHALLSPPFTACHPVLAPAAFFSICEENSCHEEQVCEAFASYAHLCRTQGVCVDWRTPAFCAMSCPPALVYNPCQHGCPRHCDTNANTSSCADHPTEGCFCPKGYLLLDGACVPEEACKQCVGEDGTMHKLMETWVPEGQPCQLCVCLDHRSINCTTQPCPTAKPPPCGPCEMPRLRQRPEQCCPDFECVCDLDSCEQPPVPLCQGGLQPVLVNPGECQPRYDCGCRKEECSQEPPPSCPPHRTLTRRETQCCDEYECVCSCVNVTASCPLGYLSSSVTNDCGCTTTSCAPDKVCVHRGTVYPVGRFWEEDCRTCTCTDVEDEVVGLRVAQCRPKICDENCKPGFTYVLREGECCGRCLAAACETKENSLRGDTEVRLQQVGSRWPDPENPCVINECVRQHEEVFVRRQNVLCGQLDLPTCPLGFQLSCKRLEGCCPSCRCEPVQGCVVNGTIIAPGSSLMEDPCTSCHCSSSSFQLQCRTTTCYSCPRGYREEKVNGSCCGKCVPTACIIRLKEGRIMELKPNDTLQDGCDTHSCWGSEQEEITWERQVTRCPAFDAQRCLAEGGSVVKIDNTCCNKCVVSECKQVSGSLQFVEIGDCKSEEKIDIPYCAGKCSSQTAYSGHTGRVEGLCSCCSATATEPRQVTLRCANGSLVLHHVLSAQGCSCAAHSCPP